MGPSNCEMKSSEARALKRARSATKATTKIKESDQIIDRMPMEFLENRQDILMDFV